jgi:hypothetical protein
MFKNSTEKRILAMVYACISGKTTEKRIVRWSERNFSIIDLKIESRRPHPKVLCVAVRSKVSPSKTGIVSDIMLTNGLF